MKVRKYTYRVAIPMNIDAESLVQELNIESRLTQKTVKNKIVRVISRLTRTHRNSRYFYHDNHIRICSKELQKILNRDYEKVLNLLKTEGIIENGKDYLPGDRCSKYRLKHKCQYVKYKYKTITIRQKEIESKTKLLDSYFNDKITIKSDDIYPKLIKFYSEIEKQLKTPKQLKVLKNWIGMMLLLIEDIDKNEFWKSRSASNKRYNSSITNISKKFRGYLKYDNQQLIQVDVKSSQVYVLASLLNHQFFKQKGDYSFYRLTKDLIDKKTRKEIMLYMFSSLMFAQFSGKPIGEISPDTKDHEEFKKFRDAPFSEDFYFHIYHLENNSFPSSEERGAIKSGIMYLLFQDLYAHRKNVESVKLFKRIYPFVNRCIERLLSDIGKSNFALFLQRAESYLVLDCIVPEFHRLCPEAPIFTIHDSILTTQKYKDQLYDVMNTVLTERTGIKPGLTVENIKEIDFTQESYVIEMVNRIIKDSKPSRYKELKNSLLKNCIEKAEEFISEWNVTSNHISNDKKDMEES